ncbi:MAG: PLP-dependent aminotransferase family protein [Eubacteriaceae bacterium]|jgi:2-aminoadipate transaminase|nr:PLP-dependent aminotransferase family protein [Eubacteriaceae bacterium]
MPAYANRVKNMKDTALYMRGLFGGMTNPDIISFGGGAPAPQALPADIIQSIACEVLASDNRGHEALQYSSTFGLKDLRQAIVSELLTPAGVTADIDNVLIVTGGLETMNLLCQVYIDPGDVILIESPAFIHCIDIFNMFEARSIPCQCDDIGLVMEDVEAKIKQYRPKMIYTVPTFHNPTGKTLTAQRRKRLAELGSEYDVIILEDDPYRDIRYSGEALPTIKSFDKTGHTVMANSFSKMFSPGSRLGYAVAEKDLILLLMDAKIATNSHSSSLDQVLCAEFFKRGYYQEHHKKICDLYRQRRDIMLECIEKFFPQGTKYTRPDGGFYIWVELPDGLDSEKLLVEAEKQNISYLAGKSWFVGEDNVGSNTMRLNFANAKEENIRYGIETLGKLFAEKRK